ncbi:DUF1090 family protein [Enterobacter bugandensis]|uniref:DUF1090 family protein n=1 Tax=Enterobacter bugandensis TaxID=881260 RepID=UPI00283AAD48|nr:DUF1090 family protein [Enterobacter bugandensis]WMU73258.1 DUF1090 family protein [Enterobacter bugandensis]
MKKILSLTFVLAAAGCTITEAVAKNQSCEQRKEAIQRQMSYAKKYNNAHELAGLERALSEVKRNCRDPSWRYSDEDDIQQKERKVKELRKKLERAEADLDNARDD